MKIHYHVALWQIFQNQYDSLILERLQGTRLKWIVATLNVFVYLREEYTTTVEHSIR